MLQSKEGLILTTLSIYRLFLIQQFKLNNKQLETFLMEATPQIERFLRIKLYGHPSIQSYYLKIECKNRK